MTPYPLFLSVVINVRNQEHELEKILAIASDCLQSLVCEYELIVVDNASDDNSINILRVLTGEGGIPNLQIYALTREIDSDAVAWMGLENALGDIVAVLNPAIDDITFLPEMLGKAVAGADVVFANNELRKKYGFIYEFANSIFNWLYRRCNGIDLTREAPQFRLLSKRLVNFILQHPRPVVTYRHLPATGGFARVNLSYSSYLISNNTKDFGESVERGIRLLVSTTRIPMRLVTALSLFGALVNLLYAFYVVAIAFIKSDVAPGWVSISLQQSGMFFLFSLVLLVLGEYILNMVTLQNEGPPYHVGQEFTSSRMTRHEKLNVVISDLKMQKNSNAKNLGS